VNQFRAHRSDPMLMGRSEAAYDALRIYPQNARWAECPVKPYAPPIVTCPTGLGRKLLADALALADEKSFVETHLWTFNGLSAARHLYEIHGFACVEERIGSQWGNEVIEQRFVRKRP
jgi:hypothetical protein